MTEKSNLVIDVPMVEVLSPKEDNVSRTMRAANSASRLRSAFGVVMGLSAVAAGSFPKGSTAQNIALGVTAVSFLSYLGGILHEQNRDRMFRDALTERTRRDCSPS